MSDTGRPTPPSYPNLEAMLGDGPWNCLQPSFIRAELRDLIAERDRLRAAFAEQLATTGRIAERHGRMREALRRVASRDCVCMGEGDRSCDPCFANMVLNEP